MQITSSFSRRLSSILLFCSGTQKPYFVARSAPLAIGMTAVMVLPIKLTATVFASILGQSKPKK